LPTADIKKVLPALAPSIVMFHRALAKDRPMILEKFVEKIIEMKDS
jgi:hypothetical protein